MPERKLLISVIGASEASPEETALAEEVGRRLAEKGATIVCGGLTGVMEAACRGAAAANGLTIGILPGEDPTKANPYVKVPIVTGLGYARNAIVARTGRAVIAIGGAYGTLSEIAFACQSGIPVVGLKTWAFTRDGVADESVVRVDSPADAVDAALSLAQAR
jgi:uncharacterized protein (TIGR00725 family)